jgi:hypothetical protein
MCTLCDNTALLRSQCSHIYMCVCVCRVGQKLALAPRPLMIYLIYIYDWIGYLEKGTLPFLSYWIFSPFHVTDSIILNFEAFRIPLINPLHAEWSQYVPLKPYSRITVAARSTAWKVFARLGAGIVGSYPTRGTNVCPRIFCVCVVLCR